MTPKAPLRLPRAALTAAASALALTAGAAMAETPDAAQAEADAAGRLDIPSFAAVEPEVDFPVCTGLARMEAGALRPIPIAESQVWDSAFDMLGEAVGRTVAVLDAKAGDPASVIQELRAEGQENELDYVIVYELAYDDAETPHAMEKLRVFSTFEGEDPEQPARAAGAAVLLDVADGSMVGVASATTFDEELNPPDIDFYTSDAGRADAFEAVATELAHEVETAFVGLMIKQGITPEEPQQAGDLTQQQIIEQADRAFGEAYGGDVDDGC